MSLAELRTDVVILACAVSAGIHGALVLGHFGDGIGAGLGFLTATVMLATLVVGLTRHLGSPILLAAAAAIFAGLLASYAFAVTTGVPLLHPDREPVDGLGLFTKAVEAVGLLAISSLLRRPTVATSLRQPKGTLT